MSGIDNPIFQDAEKAREYLEAVRWPNGPACPHCGETENVRKLEGKSHRPGLYQCRNKHGDKKRQQFTVTVGTLFERSKVPLNKWLMAAYLLCSSKKGMSTHQLHRMLGVTYKTAWFMTHRIREAMRDPVSPDLLGGGGGTVEADETYIGNKGKNLNGARGWAHKEKVLTLVEREGRARSFHVPSVNAATLRPIMMRQLREDTHLMTDEAAVYKKIGKQFTSHNSVNHSIGEYVRGDAHTNTVEGYYSILKRGLTGTYQHVSAKHLKRYLGEFDFRYNNRKISDSERAIEVLKGIGGKRLTYRGTHGRQESGLC